jgi:hypothetical protein
VYATNEIICSVQFRVAQTRVAQMSQVVDFESVMNLNLGLESSLKVFDCFAIGADFFNRHTPFARERQRCMCAESKEFPIQCNGFVDVF